MIQDYSIETTPLVYEKLSSLKEYLPFKNQIYITYLPNEEASKVHSLFKTFLNRNYSLNSLAKNFSLSVNGLKKVLTKLLNLKTIILLT